MWRMQFIKTGNLFKVVRITGPSHNLLGLEFGSPIKQIVVEALPIQNGGKSVLAAEEVSLHVLEGVKDANAQFGTSYTVVKIQFVPSDSLPVEIYKSLAHSIVQRLVKREPFG